MTERPEPLPPAEESPLLQALGIKPSFAPDADAPPVDRERLARYYCGELGPDENQEIQDCIATFRSWYAAFNEVVRTRGND